MPGLPYKCVPVTAELEGTLVAFFSAIEALGVADTFHPHPFTEEEARTRARYAGRDYYCVIVQGQDIIAYGMLRGWDAGYETPSLGIVVHPKVQRQGIGRALMNHLHEEAIRRQAPRIRLKVYPGNHTATRLYESLGYMFGAREGDQLVAIKELLAAGEAGRPRGHCG